MSTVTTISPGASSGAAVFTGPARSSDSSDQFAMEFSKTTEQMRERDDVAEAGPAVRQGSVDHSTPAPVENPQGNEVAGGTGATHQGEQVEPQQPVDTNEPVLDTDAPTDSDLEVSAEQQSLVSALVVAIAPSIILPADQSVSLDEAGAAVTLVSVLPEAVVSSPLTPTAEMNTDIVPDVPAESAEPSNTTPVATLGSATELVSAQTATQAAQAAHSGSGNLASVASTLDNVTPVIVTPVASTLDNVTTVSVTPVVSTSDNVTPVNVNSAAVVPVDLSEATAEAVANPTAQLSPTSDTPVESASPVQPATARTSPAGEGAQVETSTTVETSAAVAAAPVVANQGSDSQQSPGRSGSDRAESAIVGSDADLQSDEVGKFDADATRLVQVADAAQGLDTRNASASTNPVATSAPAPVSVDSSSPITVAEPKAPAATPLPISTQMSAHLSAFRGLADGTYETTIRLNPEELGQVSVRIQVNGGTVSIHAFGANDIAVQRLREAMPDLRQDLLQSGLDLVDSQVDQGAASFGNQREAASRRRLDSGKTEVAADNRISRPTGVDAITDVLRPEGGRVDVRV